MFGLISLYSLCIVRVDTGNQPDADLCEGTFHSRPRGEKDGAVLNKCKFILSSIQHSFISYIVHFAIISHHGMKIFSYLSLLHDNK